jgi:HlyD family secretion protein
MNNLTFMQKIKSFITNHKIWSGIIVVAIVILLYFIFKSKVSTEVRYVTSSVEKGNIVVSVSGSGQIESSDSVDLNAKTTGNITYVPVHEGQAVSKGTLIASIDSRDARIALETAQLTLDKLVKTDPLTLLQKENSLTKLYQDSWNSMSAFTVDMSTIVVGLGDLHSNGYLGYQNKMLVSQSGKDKISASEKAYWDVKANLDATTQLYKSLSSSSSNEDIQNLIVKSIDTANKISNAVKLAQASLDSTSSFLETGATPSTKVTDTQKNLTTWSTSVNGYLNSLTSSLNNIKETSVSLDTTVAGPDPLDLRQAQLNVDTKRNALADYSVVAPFDGIIATLTAKVGQSASGSIGTLIAKQKIVKISLNEVDIAKIKIGQKATLTFDAIDGLSITGSVYAIDSVGTVSQGVVTYNVSISLDVDDARVKPGMSVSAIVMTDSAQDVVVVPSSAIKNQNGLNYVEVFSAPLSPALPGAQGSTSTVLPTQVEVQIGLADDTSTEITSGLKVGDIIVTKTVTATTKTTASAPSILGAVGGNRGGGAAGGGNALRAVRGN